MRARSEGACAGGYAVIPPHPTVVDVCVSVRFQGSLQTVRLGARGRAARLPVDGGRDVVALFLRVVLVVGDQVALTRRGVLGELLTILRGCLAQLYAAHVSGEGVGGVERVPRIDDGVAGAPVERDVEAGDCRRGERERHGSEHNSLDERTNHTAISLSRHGCLEEWLPRGAPGSHRSPPPPSAVVAGISTNAHV